MIRRYNWGHELLTHQLFTSDKLKTRRQPSSRQKRAVPEGGEEEEWGKAIPNAVSLAGHGPVPPGAASAVEGSGESLTGSHGAAATTEASDRSAQGVPEAPTSSQRTGGSSAIAALGPLSPLFYNNVIIAVAQIAGFIMVGIVLAALIVLVFVWSSQPLWWPCRLKRKRSKPMEMHEARNDGKRCNSNGRVNERMNE